MKKNLLLLIAVFACAYSYGQGEIDALRYSANDLTGTARGQAMGGAFGALGGDVTGVTINPAGIGIYRSSEIVANMSVASNKAETNWQGSTNNQSKTKFNFNNLSYVGYYPLGKESLLSLNFGFNYNRLKSFDRKYSVSGKGMESSLTDYIASITNRANNGNGVRNNDMDEDLNPYKNGNIPWLSTLGWNGFLINNIENNSHYYTGLFPDEVTDPKLNVRETGNIESYDFTVSGNISDKLYIGATVAFTDIYYSMSAAYDEDFELGGGFTLSNFLETKGSGYQLKIGAIFNPIDALRLGVSYHSPTWYSMTDYYLGSADTYYEYQENGVDKVANVYRETPDQAHTDYRFHTPYTWTFSAAGIIGAKAVVSLDYEIKDYTAMNLSNINQFDYNYEQDNLYIDEDFKVASTLRAGLEYRITPQFSGRLGYAWRQNPYDAKFKNMEVSEVMTSGTVPHFTVEGDASFLTAGIGYRFTPNFYLDLAFVYRNQTDDIYFYSPVEGTEFDNVTSYPASYKNKGYKGLLTLGYKF
jgi:long-subunit fatty acid transport protein